ncbi:hypothetical protein GCM10010129_72090 [Streptomyces fumigatiscleroticus]|nr:hypothetical protein GCM10010129_72090 [Streptomyces fumigatiscleroticus]
MWVHACARGLEETPDGPLHDGRRLLTPRTAFAPGIRSEDFVRDWPGGCLELLCGGGWHGVLPLRRLSAPDAPRVKAYRRHAREGTLAPVLLWWVSFLDGWLILDGHDRAVAAPAEGAEPACVVLARVPDEAAWRRDAGRLHAEAMSWLPYEETHTPSWPLPGGPAAFGGLARRVMMLECPRD